MRTEEDSMAELDRARQRPLAIRGSGVQVPSLAFSGQHGPDRGDQLTHDDRARGRLSPPLRSRRLRWQLREVDPRVGLAEPGHHGLERQVDVDPALPHVLHVARAVPGEGVQQRVAAAVEVHHIGEGRTAPVPAEGAGALASRGPVRVRRLVEALIAGRSLSADVV